MIIIWIQIVDVTILIGAVHLASIWHLVGPSRFRHLTVSALMPLFLSLHRAAVGSLGEAEIIVSCWPGQGKGVKATAVCAIVNTVWAAATAECGQQIWP